MSGAEAIAILGVIGSIISIIDGIKQVHGAASNTKGLPEAFREVAARLPLVQDILSSAKRNIEKGDVHEGSCKGAKDVVEACKDKARKLEELFSKVIPAEGASRVDKYRSAARTLGKGGRVETLMKGMLEDIQLLAVDHSINIVTEAQQKEVAEAIEEVAALSPSLPEYTTEGTDFSAIHSGSGAINQNQAQGDQYNNPGSGQFYHAQSMTFGSTVPGDPKNACLTTLFQTLGADPRDDRDKLIGRKGRRVTGTCKWITSNELYRSWLYSRSQLLWLSGGPGKGKTMLSIFLTEELERITKDSQDTVCLQFFCDNKDDRRNTGDCVIRALLFQLLQLRPKLFDHILPDFEIQKGSLFTASSFGSLWRIFESMICDPLLGAICCVIDGLDECDESSLEVLLKRFKALFSTKSSTSSSCHLKLIVASREIPDFIADTLSSFPRIRLDPDADHEVNQDIHRFIDVEVDDLASHRQYPEPLRLQVKNTFRDRAHGTFLWVGIVAKTLRKYKPTEVEKALELFPPGLEELYARMLLQIDIGRRETAAKILLWVVMAARPLTLSELSAAIEPAVEPSGAFTRNDVIKDQVSQCGYFLTIKECEVNLIHQSAKEYLLRGTRDPNPELEFFRIQENVANLEIAKKCFDYLQNGALADGPVELKRDTLRLQAFPLLSYAALYWPEHAKSLARSEHMFDLSLPFYNKNSEVRKSWVETYMTTRYHDELSESTKLLHLASWFGILPLAENILLQKGFRNKVRRLLHLNHQRYSTTIKTALHWAAYRGHMAIVRLLLEQGADVDAKDATDSTALIVAAASGHNEVVRFLVEHGADIEASSNDGWSPLRWAVVNGDEALLLFLFEKGANIDSDNDPEGTLLYYAASNGNIAMVRLLLEKGANIEAKNNLEKTALMVAAYYRQEAIVQLLLEKGANIEAKDDLGLTALSWAVSYGQEAVVQLLLEKGANIEAKGDLGQTALSWAAENEHMAVVQLLLEKGANIGAKDCLGRTALSWAASYGQEAIVQLLLEKGANIEAKDDLGLTALSWAASYGQEAVVQLLLEKGANIEAKDDLGQTALSWAAENEHMAVVQLLLDKGADAEMIGYNKRRTAQQRQRKTGHKTMMRLLKSKRLA